MITQLKLMRFKRFEQLELSIKPLTVLTGANGVGKTSVVHALLLAHQAALLSTARVLQLNDVDSLQLGSARDLIHRQSGSDSTEIWVTDEHTLMHWTFAAPEEEPSGHYEIKQRPTQCVGALSEASQQAFVYLSAERLGPRDTLHASSLEAKDIGVGIHGQYTAQVLVSPSSFKVSRGRCFQTSEEPIQSILHQTEAWMSHIVRPIQIEPVWFPDTLVTRLRFKTPGFSTDWMRAPNMGFGVSYALPIVVAALRAPKGALLLIENPEAHLHPAGQSAMGAFLVQMAADGVQVLVETHSDHILNGIRKTVANNIHTLPAEHVALHFFHDERHGGLPVQSLHILQTGQLSAWPIGFFDQAQRDLAEIARTQRKKP